MMVTADKAEAQRLNGATGDLCHSRSEIRSDRGQCYDLNSGVTRNFLIIK